MRRRAQAFRACIEAWLCNRKYQPNRWQPIIIVGVISHAERRKLHGKASSTQVMYKKVRSVLIYKSCFSFPQKHQTCDLCHFPWGSLQAQLLHLPPVFYLFVFSQT
jgi:hypothetical protein